MRRKFLLKVMILSLLFVAMGGGDLFAQSVTTVTSEDELAAAFAAGGKVALGASFKVDNTIEIKLGKTVTLDLNGYEISTEKEIYLIDNNGDLTINDGSENKSGGLVVGLGIRNGYEKPARSIAAKLTIHGGTFKNIYPDNGAAVYNQGQLWIYGGNFYGQNVAISNDNAMAYIYGGYIDGYKYAITNTLLLEINDAQISGVIKTTSSSASTTISDAVTFYEARIGEPANYTSYKTFAEALTAAGNMTGDVTVDILEKVTMKNNLSGNYSSIEFVGKDTDAEIYLDVQGYITATGKKVAFEDLTLSKSAGGFITNAGFMNVAFGVYDVTEVTYTGCNFANGAYASSGKVTYNDCTFKRSHDKYGLWAYGNVDVTVNGGKFDDYRGIKMYAEGAAKTVDLTVKNVDFSAVTDKPAIVLTYGESVNLENNTYSSTGVFELDKDGAPNGTEVTADIADLSCMNDIYSDCGVLVDGKIYTTIDDAKGVAKEGSVVTLFYEPETQVELPYGVELNTNNYGNVVVRDYYTYAEFNEYVRNGNCANLENKKVVLKDTERSYQNNQTAQFFVGATNINITDPVETVTLNKVTFEFLDDDNTNTYTSGELQVFAKNISFTECTFIGTAVSPWGVSNNENAETAAFIDCEWKNLRGRYGVHQNRASYLTVTGCTFTDCERGIHTNSSTPLNITITGNTFTGIGDAYGVLCIAGNGNVGNATLNITGNIATGQTFLRQLNENATYEQISAILNTDNNTYGTAYVVGSKVPVAKIGDKTYYKFEEAISSVGAGDVVIELLSDATLNYPARKEYGTNETTSLTINGHGNILTLHQTDTDWSSLGLVNEDAKFVFNNMTINKTKAGGNGAWNNHAINFYANVEMNGVTVNNSMQVTKGANLNNVTINEGGGYYGLWVSAQEQTVTMNGGAINATNGGRGIKIADEYVDAPAKVTLSVEGTTFNTAKKAAVLVTSTAGATITVSEVNIENVAEDNENFAWVDEDRAANFGEVTVNGNPAYIEGGIELYVAAIMKNDKEYGYYKKLRKAVDAVKDGETITLIADCAENVTLSEKTGLYYTIDGKNKTMTGKITVNSLSDTNDNRRITIKNINFKDETSDGVDFITAVNTNHYPRLTIEGCVFTGSGDDKDVAIRLKSSHSVIIKNCTGTKLHSFLQNTSGWNLTINEVTVTDSKGGLALGTVQGVTVKKCNVTTDTYGIRLDADTYNNNAVIESCTVNAFIPVVVRKVNTTSNIKFEGTNTMTQTNTDGLWCAIGKTEYETNGVMPEAPETGYVSVTLNDENLDVNGIYNAISGNGSEDEPYYIKTVADLKFFRDQVNGGNNYAGKYVKLADDIDLLTIGNWTPIGDITYDTKNNPYQPTDYTKVFSGVFDGNNKVIYNLTINKTVGGADTQANVGFFGMTGEGAVIKNLTLTNVNINTDGRNVGALAGFAYKATLDNITVNGVIDIEGGNNVSGVAGMTRYYDMSATNIEVIGNDGSAIVGNNIVGGIFAEIAPNVSEQKFENLSVENVAITGVGGVGGIVGLLTTGAVNNVTVKNVALTGNTLYQGDAMGRIRLGSVSGLMGGKYATIANVTTENVTAKNLDGNAVVLPIIGANFDASSNATEARIGDTYYATLQIAIDAAKAGDNTNTIQLLADITGDVTILQKEDINIVIDGKKAENENYQFGGTIYVDGNNRHTGAEKLTIQNVNFYTEKTTSHDFISANVANQYTHNVTVKGCNFATSVTNVNNKVVGLRLRQAYGIAVENCTSNNIFSLMWSTGVVGLGLNEVTVNNCTEGISIGGKSQNVTITDSNITSPSFGIRACVEGGQFTMTSSTINALVPVVVRNENVITDLAQYTLSFTFNGTNNIVESNPTNYWFVAGETEYKGADEVMPTAPKGQVSVTLNDTGLRYEDVYGNYYELAGEGTADNPYTIANLYELKFFRDQVNAGNNYAGKYVKLTADIDLAEGQTRGAVSNWEPIGWYIDKNNNAPFNGIFDGDSKTIKNLVINGDGKNNQGFFGQTNNGEIKNVIFENAKVSGRLNVGVVAGTPYTSKYTNIKVKGHVEVNGMSYVGGVGGKNAYANWTDITVNVDGESYVKATSTENDTQYRTYVGGVIGFNGEGGHTFKNITSNINVIGDVCDIGGIFGIAHYGNKFENITHTGTVTNTNSNAEDVVETGLIAGVWHNQAGTSVTFTNTTSDGTISVPNVTGVTFPNDGLIGAAYTTSNETSSTSGSLTINGEQVYPYVAKIDEVGYNTLAKAITAAQNKDVVTLLWVEGDAPIAMNASLYGKEVTITGTATVDWSKGWLFVGRGGEGDATLIFDGANLTSASDNASTGIHVSGREKDTDNKYDGTVIINNSIIELDFLINKGAMTLDNSTLTVRNGFSVGGRPAHETESGADATATMTLNNGSKVVVNNHNGMGLGYEAIGIMNINSGSTFETTQSFLITAKGTMNVNGGNVKVAGTLTNNGTINVTGESTLNIEKLEGSSIELNEGAIVKNSTVGGDAYIAGNVIFRGDNTFNMITDYGDYYSQVTPSMWTVEAGASLTLTKTDRYGLGYGDKVTVYGELEYEEALTARASLTDEDASVNMYGGLVGMTNSAAPNAENSFTATNAYLIFGVNGDKSFGNKPGNYYGNYTFTFNNSVVTANGFKFYEDNGTSTVKFSNSDLLVNGVLMTNDASSSFTFENSVVLSKAQNNGTDDKNQNAGVMTLTNTQFTYSAAFTNVGTLNLDLSSKLTAPSVTGNGIINIDATDFDGNEICVISANMASFEGVINVEGAHYMKKDNGIYVTGAQGTLTKAYTSATGYWGECGGNANESFVLKFYNDGTYMGQTLLNDIDNIIDGDVYVTWSIDLNIDPNAEGYWAMSWDIRPTLAMQPNRVEQWIDGVKVAECAVEPNWADNIFPVVAAVTGENDVILSYVNNTTGATLKDAFAAGGNVTILRDFNLSETVTVPTDKTVVLDLNGKAIAMTNNIITTTYAINNLGTLTIEDSSTDKTGSVSARGIYNGYDANGNNVATAKITIEGGTFNAKGENGGAAVYNYGIADIKGGKFTSVGSYSLNNQSGASMTIADGVEATGGIYNSGATLTVNGGKISNLRDGAHTIYSWDSNVTLKDGEIHNENSKNATIFADGTSEVNIVDGTFTIKVVDESSSYLIDTDSKLNISGGEFTGGIRVQANGNMSITEGTYHNNHGNYNVYTGGSLVISGGTFCENAKTFVENNLAQGYALKELANGYYTVIQVAGTQTTELITGWNWFSTYIKQGNDGLSLLQNALDPYGVEIKNREGFTRYYPGLNDWSPSQTLTSVSTTKMYMIKTSAAHTLELEGSFEDENVEITIAPGWNWIGYPVHEEGISFEDALSNIKPAHGDIIKSQSLYAQYIDMFGTAGWAVENGESLIMNPGEGYKYYSNKSQVFRFTYSTEVNSKRETSIETIDNYWLTDANQYSGNMTMLAMLSVDGEIVKGNYEVAAFANGECRGSAHPIYIEALDAYVLLMTIHGEEVEELTFKYYDVNCGTEYELNNRINYSDDAIVGSFEEPYMFNLGILNIDETSVENISIYPNPTTTGKEINLQAVCDKVEVFNALGVKVAEYTNVDSIDAIETAGIYVIRVTIDGNARNCRLVVR